MLALRSSQPLLGVFLLAAACSVEPTVPNASGKGAGLTCAASAECQSLACNEGKCTAVTGGNPTDKVKNGDETDVDCGGNAPTCEDGKACKIGGDCSSKSCSANVCQVPSPTDGLKNGDETDVDCGGSKAPKCGTDRGCAKNDDCSSAACSYAKKCITTPSCTGHFGGDTCGAGETGSGEAQHESCCTMVKDPVMGVSVGKYYVTAGRMRAFVERFDGNLRAWAQTGPKGWEPDWTEQLPSSMAEALDLLGPNTKRGCSIPGHGGRTYWQESANGDSAEKSDFSKDVLDEKALNCVPWVMAQAICHFDGGRLASSQEIMGVMRNHGETRFPWGDSPPFRFRSPMDEAVHAYSYETPNAPSFRVDDESGGPLDRAFFIAPPGRRPLGGNQLGIQDGIGNVMSWVADGPNRFSWTSSWEDSHPIAGGGAPALDTWQFKERLGYWAIGARCVVDD